MKSVAVGLGLGLIPDSGDSEKINTESTITPPDPDKTVYGQYGGNAGNQGFYDDNTPFGIQSTEQVVTPQDLSGQGENRKLDRSPAVSSGGGLMASGMEAAIAMQKEGEPNIIDISGRGSTALALNESGILGDQEFNRKVGLDNSDPINQFEQDSRAFLSIRDDGEPAFFQAIGGGFAEFDHQAEDPIVQEYTEDLPYNPGRHTFIPISNDRAVASIGGSVRNRDLVDDGRIGYNNNDGNYFQAPISSDGDVVAAAGENAVLAILAVVNRQT